MKLPCCARRGESVFFKGVAIGRSTTLLWKTTHLKIWTSQTELDGFNIWLKEEEEEEQGEGEEKKKRRRRIGS